MVTGGSWLRLSPGSRSGLHFGSIMNRAWVRGACPLAPARGFLGVMRGKPPVVTGGLWLRLSPGLRPGLPFGSIMNRAWVRSACPLAPARGFLACDAWEAPGGNRGIVAALIPGLAPGASFRVDHESCAGAWHLSARSRSGLYSISSARLPCGSAACGCPALGNPQRKLGARRRLLTQVAHVKHGRGAYRFAKIWTSSVRPGSLTLCGIFSVFLRGNSDC